MTLKATDTEAISELIKNIINWRTQIFWVAALILFLNNYWGSESKDLKCLLLMIFLNVRNYCPVEAVYHPRRNEQHYEILKSRKT